MAKNNSNDLLIGGAIVLGAWYFLTRYKTVNGLNFVIRGISFQGGMVRLTLGVQNSSSNILNFQSLSGTLYLNGTGVGNVSSFTPTVIAANAETAVPIFVTPNLIGDISLVAQGAANGFGSLQPTLTGNVNISDTQIPINLKLS